jgi:hypothetical protein
MGSYGHICLVGIGRRQERHFLVMLHEVIHPGNMDLGIAEGSGQPGFTSRITVSAASTMSFS